MTIKQQKKLFNLAGNITNNTKLNEDEKKKQLQETRDKQIDKAISRLEVYVNRSKKALVKHEKSLKKTSSPSKKDKITRKKIEPTLQNIENLKDEQDDVEYIIRTIFDTASSETSSDAVSKKLLHFLKIRYLDKSMFFIASAISILGVWSILFPSTYLLSTLLMFICIGFLIGNAIMKYNTFKADMMIGYNLQEESDKTELKEYKKQYYKYHSSFNRFAQVICYILYASSISFIAPYLVSVEQEVFVYEQLGYLVGTIFLIIVMFAIRKVMSPMHIIFLSSYFDIGLSRD